MPIDYKAIASQADDLTDDKLAAIAADADSVSPSAGQGPLAEQPSAPGPSSSLSGIAHALAAPLGIPRNISDPAAQALLTTRQSLRDIDNPNRPLPPAGSRGRQLVEQGGVKGPGDVAGAMAKGAVLQPPPSTSGAGGRLLADFLRDPSNPIGGGLSAAAGWGADELAGWLTTKAAEAEKAGSPDLARRFSAARDLLVKGETTAEDLLTDPLIAGGYLKGILGKAIPAGGQVFGTTIPGLETASRLAQRFSHLTAPPAILGGAADVGGKTVGAAQSAAEGGDPRLLAEALPEAAAQAAILSQASPSEWLKNPSAAKPPRTLEERVGRLTNPPVTPEWAARWNEKLSRIPVAGRITSSRVGAYTNSGGLLKALGRESVAPEVVKTVVDAISTDPTLTKGEGTSQAPKPNLSIPEISKAVEDQGLTTTDVVNVVKLLEKHGFVKPQTAHFGKGPQEGAYTVPDHADWQYLRSEISKVKEGPENGGDYFRRTGHVLPVEVPPPAPKGPEKDLPPIKVQPLERPKNKAKAAKAAKASKQEFADRPAAIRRPGELGANSPILQAAEPLDLTPPPPLEETTPGVPPLEANNRPFFPPPASGGPISPEGPQLPPPPIPEGKPPFYPGQPGTKRISPSPPPPQEATPEPPPGIPPAPDITPPQEAAAPPAPLGSRPPAALPKGPVLEPPPPRATPGMAPPEPPAELPPPPRVLTTEQRSYLKEKGIPVRFAEKLLDMTPDDALAAIKAHKTLGKLHGNAQLKILRTLFSADFAPPPGRGTHKIVTEAELKRPPIGVPSMGKGPVEGPKANDPFKGSSITKTTTNPLLPGGELTSPPQRVSSSALNPKWLSTQEILSDLPPDYGSGSEGVWKREQFSEDEIPPHTPKEHKRFAYIPEEGRWVSAPDKIESFSSLDAGSPGEGKIGKWFTKKDRKGSIIEPMQHHNLAWNGTGEVVNSVISEKAESLEEASRPERIRESLLKNTEESRHVTLEDAKEAVKKANEELGYERFSLENIPTTVYIVKSAVPNYYLYTPEGPGGPPPGSITDVVVNIPNIRDLFFEAAGKNPKTVVRPSGWEASSPVVEKMGNPGHLYRGMTEEEYKATVGSGRGVESSQRFSIPGEGTSLATDFPTAEDYVNFGRDDPRKTGKPTYVVEVAGEGEKPGSDGYVKAKTAISPDRIRRVWRFSPERGALVAEQIK